MAQTDPRVARLRDAWERSGITLTDVAAELGMTKVNLSRKLRGARAMTLGEVDAVAKFFGETIVLGAPLRRRAA